MLLCIITAFTAKPSNGGETNRESQVASSEQTKQTSFEVRRYDVVGNTILAPKVVAGVLDPFTGKNVTMEDIRKGLGELQLAYRQRGYVTVGISLPQQQVTNGTVRVNVTESKLADVRVRGNKHYSKANVLRSLPSLHTNEILNSHIFQSELDQANANRDRQIYPRIEPGPLPGTSALVLNVKDRLPVHGRAEFDNYNTPGTPELRINLSGQYNNLWQRDHQVGLSYGFSPERFKEKGLMTDYFFDEPLISYYGSYYRIPLGQKSVEEKIIANPRFGYNEATHQFILPPSGNTPDITFYASASANDTGVKYGPLKSLGGNDVFLVNTITSGRNLGVNENLGTRFSMPLVDEEHYRIGGFLGLDYKQYSLTSYSTNSTIITIVALTSSSGSFADASTQTDNSPDPILKNHVHYLPVNGGFDFSENDHTGSSSANLTATVNLLGHSKDFQALAYSPNSQTHYAKFNLSLNREQKLFAGYSLMAKAAAQASTSPLISNEQFALGGNSNVRGYYDGDDYGDSGWYGSLELRTPYWETSVSSLLDYVPTWLRASAFTDYGQRYMIDPGHGISATRSFLGAGVGFTANINNHFDARVQVAVPVLDSVNSASGSTRVYFSIGGQF